MPDSAMRKLHDQMDFNDNRLSLKLGCQDGSNGELKTLVAEENVGQLREYQNHR